MSVEVLQLVAGIATPMANLVETELEFLRDQCEAFRVEYPPMADWMTRLVDAERQRRSEGQTRFPDPPALWSMAGSELAACFRATLVLVQSATTERLRDVADGLLLFVGSFVNRRLIEAGSFASN